MKDNTLLGLTKQLIALALLVLTIASCKKDNEPGKGTTAAIIDYHQTAPTKFIDVAGSAYAYRVLGDKDGIPLVMLSALGGSMDDWDPAITNGLAQKYKVIIFDNQGVGLSKGTTPDNITAMANDAANFIKALGYTKVNVMGFSMGSFISQQLVLDHPTLVNKIILTGTGPKGSEGLSNLPNLLAAAAGLSPEESLLRFAFTSSAKSIEAGKESYARTQKRTVDRDLPVNAQSGGAQLTAVLGWAQPYPNAFNELKTITQPVLIAQGQEDIPVPVINATNLYKNIPNASLITYPDAGHAAVFQYHDEFVQAATNFLSK
ncbi:Pimeloyl-ACP methyl ester carboxylesterase [Mucilaginibacter gossypiicola]|uniref:Pimeloyl-ACP methyl ester carboxylesterase n=1 Tax=Mucilaginibacter gossypiicola TaxID=551995 RepID=A0A1H8NTK4_9SPHI|nr:alpha/beta hydrolase [Mucilaginibacter gossypiicola]SEO32965.1 Pimeloyl-ACP methyl ester carboxylesterase [Mucilaginibacter gossypiicola]